MVEAPRRPVFYDPTGRRARWLRRAGGAVGTLVSVLSAAFVTSVVVHPVLPLLHLPPVPGLPRAKDLPRTLPRWTPTRRHARARRAIHRLRHAWRAERRARRASTPGRPFVVAFAAGGDDAARAALERAWPALDALAPTWLHLQPGAEPLRVTIDARWAATLRALPRRLPLWPVVQNDGPHGWNGALAAAILASTSRRRLLAARVERALAALGAAAVVVDFEDLPPGALPNLRRFLAELRARLAPQHRAVWVAAPVADPTWDLPRLAAVADGVLLMAYDEHWAQGAPGPVAGQDWFERVLTPALAALDPRRVIVALGAYGYDWPSRGDAAAVTFADAMRLAAEAGSPILWDSASANPVLAYRDDRGRHHEVWFLDAVTAANEARWLRAHGVDRLAIWRLGAEDPALWAALRASDAALPALLTLVPPSGGVEVEGRGEIVELASTPRAGRRVLARDASGGWTERYLRLPTATVVRRLGDHPGWIALTFDDGPDPRWTPAILAILRRYHVPATFFVIGAQAQAHPGLVRRLLADGHEIGNHTFTHPNLGFTSPRLVVLELDATQRLLEAITGRSTVLFRPPYFGDAEPTTADELRAVAVAQRLGYITVGLHLDPQDWRPRDAQGRRRTPEDLVRSVLAQLAQRDPERRGQVVLLHDGGGDRSLTVRALPQLLTALRQRGYRFVPVSALLGLRRDQVLPPVTAANSVYARLDALAFGAWAASRWAVGLLFLVGVALGLVRVLLLGTLAIAHWRRERWRIGPTVAPRVACLVPTHNEARVIERTVRRLLASDYPDFEVVVIDDGSTDGTADVVRRAFAHEPRLRLLTQPNLGKAAALERGWRSTTAPIIVTLDADTLVEPGTLRALVRPFADPRVAAVAGNAKVGNQRNALTRWQAIEYVTAQNLERRALARLGCVTVVPGAIGAWRRSWLARVHGLSEDTVAEDQDLTLRVARAGGRIEFAADAIAWTEAPETLGGLLRQRLRWAFGTLQCAWKHRGALGRGGALGWFGLPHLWVFHIVFPLLAPLVDVVALGAVATALWAHWSHEPTLATGALRGLLFFACLFWVLDALGAILAYRLDGHERRPPLRTWIAQRLVYRHLLILALARSAVRALAGARVPWLRVERRATVVVPG